MAFQAGTRVDPRLLDYSGYTQGVTNAAAINAKALASLGQAVGEGIDKYNEKKLQKEQKKQATPVIASFLRQIDPSLSEEQSNAGATSFINSVGIEGVQAAIPIFALEGMKSQNKIRLAQIEAFGDLAKQDELTPKERETALKGFEQGGVYYNQGFRFVGGQLVQEVNTKPGFNIGDILPGRSEYKQVPVTSGPVYELAKRVGRLAETPELDTSTIGQPPVGTGTVSTEPDSPNPLDLDMPEEEAPTLEQFTDITSQVDYGEFNVPEPVIKKQEGYRDLTPVDRPKTYKEFKESKRKRSDATPEKYQAYLDNFEYKYPMTFEEFSSPNTGLINYEPGEGLTLDFSDRGRFGGSEERYINEYLPRFY
jgi:hypothetical protein